MEFDDAVRRIGQCGKYQIMIVCMRGLTAFHNAFTTLGIVFIAAVPDHWCHTPEIDHLNLTDAYIRNITIPLVVRNGQSEYSSCSRYKWNYTEWTDIDAKEAMALDRNNVSVEACPSGWTYDTTVYTSSIVSQWNLVCGRSILRAMSTSLYMAGLMVGNIIASSIADLYGRRPTFIGFFWVSYVLAIALPFSPNYVAFCTMRFIIAVCNIGFINSGFVIVMEIVGPDYRANVGLASQSWFGVGMMIYAAFAYFIRDWVILCLATSALISPVCFAMFLLHESPRWLYLHGYRDKADVIMERIARMNGVDIHGVPDINIQQVTKNGYVWDIWRTRRMASRTTILCVIGISSCMVYFGLTLNTSNLGGNDFVNFFISACTEIASYILCGVVVYYVGTRKAQCLAMILAGVPLLLIMLVPPGLNWVTVTLAMIGKLGISGAFGAVMVLTAEVYPTSVRNIGIGCVSFSARIGGIIAPLINELSKHNRFIPLVIFGMLSIGAGLLTLVLPETKGAALTETLEDGERLGSNTISINQQVENEQTLPLKGSSSDVVIKTTYLTYLTPNHNAD